MYTNLAALHLLITKSPSLSISRVALCVSIALKDYVDVFINILLDCIIRSNSRRINLQNQLAIPGCDGQ